MQRSYPSSVFPGITLRRTIQLIVPFLVTSMAFGMSGCAEPRTSPSSFGSAVSLIETRQVEEIDVDLAIRYGLNGVRSAVDADAYNEASQKAECDGNHVSMVAFEALLHHLAKRTDYSLNDLMEIAIQSLTEKLEYPTVYISPEKAARFAEMVTNNALVGVEITKPGNWPVITDVLSGSPADTAGLKPGDRIVEIDGQSTEGWGLVQTVEKLVGREKSKVSITVVPSEKELPQAVVVTRVPSSSLRTVKHRRLNGHVGYISVPLLNGESNRDLADVLARFRRESELKAIVLDLRGNKGGSLRAVREVTDQFIREGLIFWVQQGGGRLPDSCFGTNQGTEPSLPLVVFVDKETASGGEIVANALRAHAEAILVGQKTTGSGMVDHVFPLPNGGRIRLPIAWIGVKDGERLEGHGVVPDIPLACDLDQIDTIAQALARSDFLPRSQMLARIREAIAVRK